MKVQQVCPQCGCKEFKTGYEVVRYPFGVKEVEHYCVVVCKNCQFGYLIRKEDVE